MTQTVLSIDRARFNWPGSDRFTLSIDAFEMDRSAHVLLVGPSGSGKSTLLSLIAGIIVADRGRVAVLGEDLATLRAGQRDRFRAEHLGIIFQQFNLLPYASARDNVLLALAFAPKRRALAMERVDLTSEVDRLLSRLGLDPDSIGPAAAASLSVGQQQRVACARALIGRPALIIADEPTSALDRSNQARFLELMLAEASAAGATLLMVSHDETLASQFSQVVRLDDIARISMAGATEETVRDPAGATA